VGASRSVEVAGVMSQAEESTLLSRSHVSTMVASPGLEEERGSIIGFEFPLDCPPLVRTLLPRCYNSSLVLKTMMVSLIQMLVLNFA
jgi:hypothetical protein